MLWLFKMIWVAAVIWQLSGSHRKSRVLACFSESSHSYCTGRNTLSAAHQKTQLAWAEKPSCFWGKPPRAGAEPNSLLGTRCWHAGRGLKELPLLSLHMKEESRAAGASLSPSPPPLPEIWNPCKSLSFPTDRGWDADGLRCICAQTSYLQFFLTHNQFVYSY